MKLNPSSQINLKISFTEFVKKASRTQDLIEGNKYFFKDNYNQAFEYHQKSIQIDLNNAVTYFCLGVAYYILGNYQ
ncbi:MAG: tetratricopeptide repeat protein [Candidatus Omnitrophica bacterium]|nr:tetratricopeptide repeat protein [Candidatus Omnitrophota bacterium]MCM8830813.1 tetratricopeptide repeat protein [Candidatus Omnitrophota bacterium]